MKADEFMRWRDGMGVTVAKAAEMLGLSRQTMYTYLRGDVPVPRAVELACAALELGVRSYPPAPLPSPSSWPTPGVLAAPFAGPPGAPALADA
jgi:DNA-binding XRE family transcriptional regulator